MKFKREMSFLKRLEMKEEYLQLLWKGYNRSNKLRVEI